MCLRGYLVGERFQNGGFACVVKSEDEDPEFFFFAFSEIFQDAHEPSSLC